MLWSCWWHWFFFPFLLSITSCYLTISPMRSCKLVHVKFYLSLQTRYQLHTDNIYLYIYFFIKYFIVVPYPTKPRRKSKCVDVVCLALYVRRQRLVSSIFEKVWYRKILFPLPMLPYWTCTVIKAVFVILFFIISQTCLRFSVVCVEQVGCEPISPCCIPTSHACAMESL